MFTGEIVVFVCEHPDGCDHYICESAVKEWQRLGEGIWSPSPIMCIDHDCEMRRVFLDLAKPILKLKDEVPKGPFATQVILTDQDYEHAPIHIIEGDSVDINAGGVTCTLTLHNGIRLRFRGNKR